MTRWRARWSDLPLRNRLTVVVAVPVALAIGVAVTVAYVEVRHELRSQIDDQLRHQATELQRQAAFFTGRGLPPLNLRVEFGQPGGYAQELAPDGSIAPASNQTVVLPVRASDLGVAAGTRHASLRDTRVDGVRVRMLTAPVTPGLAVQIALPLTAADGQLHRLAVAFTLLALGALAVAVFLTWFFTRRTLSPVARLTDAAEQIATTKDLTHRIEGARGDELGRLAASFNSMLDALEKSLAAQRQLVADASHELRTPLASLRTNSEVLKDFDRLGPEQRASLIAGLVTQIDELTGLVADVVELARGDEPPREVEPVEFDALVERAVAQARRHWPAATFTLKTAPVTVLGVPQRLERAATNLLDNAGKFSPGGALIEVELRADGRLTVRDHGPGISSDALPNVFERFYRADEARSLPGSGLGLAIVKQVADSHRGAVSVRNADDGGVIAELALPLAPSADIQVDAPSSAATHTSV